jgi:hypothetical protein
VPPRCGTLERLLTQWRHASYAAVINAPAAKTGILGDPSTGQFVAPIVAAALCIKPRGLLTEPQAAKVNAFKTCLRNSQRCAGWRRVSVPSCEETIPRNATFGCAMRIAPGYTTSVASPGLCVKTSQQFAVRSPKPRATAKPKVELPNSSNDLSSKPFAGFTQIEEDPRRLRRNHLAAT